MDTFTKIANQNCVIMTIMYMDFEILILLSKFVKIISREN